MASSTTESNDYGYVWEGSATGTNPIERIWVKGAEGLDDVAAVAFGMDAKGEVVRDTGVISSGKLTFDSVEGMFNCLCPFGSECSAWKLYIWNRNENLGVRDVEWEAGENIPVSNIVDELNAVKQRAKDHTTNIARALRVPEAGSDNLFVPPVEARKGKVLGFDDDGNPVVGKAVLQIQEIYELFEKMLALYEEMKKTFEAFKKELAAWEAEFKAWLEAKIEAFKKELAAWESELKAWLEAKKQELLAWEADIKAWGDRFKQELAEWKAAFEQELAAWEEALKKWAEDFQKRMEALYEELTQYRYKVVTREEYDALCRAGKIDDGSIYFVKGTFDVGYVFYGLLKEYFPDIILPIENGPFEEDVDLRRVARLDKFNVFKTANRFLYQCQMLEAPTDPLHLVRLCDLEDWEGGGGDKGYLVAKVFDDVVPTTGASVGKDENGYLRVALAGTSKAGAVRLAMSVDDFGGVMTAEKTKEALNGVEQNLGANFAKFEEGTSTAETGAKHGKSLLASQNGEDGGFYVGANRSTTRAWTQYLTRYQQAGVRAYGETNGEYEDYLWSPRTADDEPLRVARLKDFDRIVNPTLVVSTEGEKTEEPDENANMTAWVGTLGALKGLEEDDATAIVPDAVSVWRRTSGTTVNATLNMRMKIMRWDEASGAWAIAAKSKETRVWSNFANGEEIKFTFAWEGDGIPANEKVIIGFVRMTEEDAAGTFTQASCAQTTTRSGAMTVAPGLSTREPAVQAYAPVMRLGTARVLTPAGIEALIADAESGGGSGGSGVTEEWVRSNFVPLGGDFTTSGAGTFNGATTFGGEVNVLSGNVVRFRDGEGNAAVSLRFTDSPTGGVLNQGSASTTTAMTWMSGNYMSWFSSEFLRMYSGESVGSPTAKIEANPNGVILAAGANDATKIVIDAGRIQVSGAPLTLNVAPTATNHATTKGYVDKKVAALEADYAKFEEGTSTAETGAKHGKSLLASQNGEDGGFYVGANRSATRAWTQNMTRYRQTGVRAYGETTGKHEDYLWSPRTEEDEPLRVARLKDFAAMEAKIAALKERIEALEELPAEGYIRLRIETTEANQSFPLFYRITTEEGGYVSVDWGDGNTETLTGATTYSPRHTYATAGEYVVKLTGSKFTGVTGSNSSSYDAFQAALREILSLKMPKDSTSVSLRNTFYGCGNLTGSIPKWDDRITNAYGAYYGCTGLTGSIPAWGANITNATLTYRNCRGLTGNIPAWGANITNAYGAYYGCTGLTGSIPAWGANITNASQTYRNCRGLTGNIPAWGENITEVRYTYDGCSGLTGCSEELLQDPMPSRITSHADCVSGCADAVRQHFTEDWGGTKTS